MNWAAGIIQKRPALPVAIAMIVGVLLHDLLPHRPVIFLAFASFVLLAAMFSAKKFWRWVYLLVCTALVGLALAQLHAFFFAEDHIAQYTSESQRLVWLEAQIDSPPRTLGDPFAKHRPTALRQMMRAHVTRICTTDGWRSASGRIFLMILDLNPQLMEGQQIRVNGYLAGPTAAMNPGEFDWAGYCHRQGIYAVVFAPRLGDVDVISQPKFDFLRHLRASARENLSRGFTEDFSLDHALLRDLLFGDNDSLLRQLHEDFREAGASHLLCISGLHIVILAWFVFQLCRTLRLHPRSSALITTGSLLLYGAVITPASPAFRAIFLALAYTVSLLARRKVDALHLLSLVAIGLLAWQPLELYSPGFQLSFLTVAGLIVGTPRLKNLLVKLRDPDIVVAQSFRPPTGIDLFRQRAVHWLLDAFSATIIAWSISLPLIGYHFAQFNPLAVLSAIVLTPLTFIAMIGGLLKIILTIIFPAAAHSFVVLAVAGSQLFRGGTSLLSHLPIGHFPFAPPPLSLIAFYYGLMLVILLPLRRWIRVTSVGGCCVFLLLPFQSYFVSTGPAMKITLLSVGNGDCALIQPRGSEPILVDAGSLSFADFDDTILQPFLQNQGISRLGAAILTNTNYERISGIESLAEQQMIRQVFISPQFQSQSYESYPAQRLLEMLQIVDIPVHLLTAGDRIPLSGNSEIQILWPSAKIEYAPADCSFVLRITCNGKSILLPSDIQVDGQRQLLIHAAQLKADVMVAPHNGSADPMTSSFISAVAPQFVLSSNDKTLTQPQRDLEKLTGSAKLLRTNSAGAITVTIDDAGKINVESVH